MARKAGKNILDEKNRSRNTESEIMGSVSSVVDFIKQQTVLNLAKAVGEGKIEVSNEELKKICFYVETSITNSFLNSSNEIENAIRR